MVERENWVRRKIYTLEDDPMGPENHWLVEEINLPGGQTARVHISFPECNHHSENNPLVRLIVGKLIIRIIAQSDQLPHDPRSHGSQLPQKDFF